MIKFGMAARLALVGAAAVATAALAAPSASAAGSPQITNLGCDSAAKQITCSAMDGGGTAPYQFEWNGQPAINGFYHVGCTVPSHLSVQFTVIDATGASASATAGVWCSGNSQN